MTISPRITDFADGISAIDTEYVRPMMDASHLIVNGGRAAFVDTGTGHSVPLLMAALEEKGLDFKMEAHTSEIIGDDGASLRPGLHRGQRQPVEVDRCGVANGDLIAPRADEARNLARQQRQRRHWNPNTDCSSRFSANYGNGNYQAWYDFRQSTRYYSDTL